MKVKIITATDYHYSWLKTHDHHIRPESLRNKIKAKEVLVAVQAGKIIGWLRYGYFWDNTPFMNMLMVEKLFRNQQVGSQLVEHWEKMMKKRKYRFVMTSTQTNETAKDFYKKLKYQLVGDFKLPNEPKELIFIKTL